MKRASNHPGQRGIYEALADKTILLDCRHLGMGGAGRATELLLSGLQSVGPPGRWLLWGPCETKRYAWPGAECRPSDISPVAWAGQRQLLSVPPNDVALYMHQTRPLRPGRSITVIHDTTQLRYGTRAAPQMLKRIYLRSVALVSSGILTVSQFSKSCIERDLKVPASKIEVVAYPCDTAMAKRVAMLRDKLASRDVVIYVGRAAPHKNLDRLLEAFAGTDFHRRGGSLKLVGVGQAEEGLGRRAEAVGLKNISIDRWCSQEQLERLYATSRALVLPSLEEGFGLPAWEAACCGLPVAVSDGGALPEVASGAADPFPASSVEAIAGAIDRAVLQPAPAQAPQGPSPAEFAEKFVAAVRRVL